MQKMHLGPSYKTEHGTAYRVVIPMTRWYGPSSGLSAHHILVPDRVLESMSCSRVGGNLVKKGTEINENLWIRVQLINNDEGGVHNYMLFANGMTPQLQLMSEVVGGEYLRGASIDDLPPYLVNPVRMLKIRGRSTDDAMLTHNTMWFYGLTITAQCLTETTRRSKWVFEDQGEKIYRQLLDVLPDRDSIEVSG